MIHYETNRTLLEELNKQVEGHVEFKKMLINLINVSKIRHKQIYHDNLHSDYVLRPLNVLAIGYSGCGKTETVDQIHRLIEFPFLRIDATQLQPTGAASGGIKSSDLKNMILDHAKMLWNQKKYYPTIEGAVQQMVVHIDEIDKIANRKFSSDWNAHVQANFLTMLDDRTGVLSGVSYILTGAFTGLDEILGVSDKKTMGFFDEDITDLTHCKMLDEALIEFGLIPEIVGRMSHITMLNKFDEKDYRRILDNNLIPRLFNDLVEFRCYDFSLTEEQKTALCARTVRSGQGVRYLKRELDKLLIEIQFSYEERSHELLALGHENWQDMIVDKENFDGETIDEN